MPDDFEVIQSKILQICETIKLLTRMENNNLLRSYEPAVEVAIKQPDETFATWRTEIKLIFPGDRIVVPPEWCGYGDSLADCLNGNLLFLKYELRDRVINYNLCIQDIESSLC